MTELIAVLLGLMSVFFLALVFLGGIDVATALGIVGYVFAGIAFLMVFSLSLATLRKGKPRKVFILYDAQDERFVSQLYSALKMAPIRILWDKQEVQVGDNVEEKLEELFNSSSEIIFVVSHSSVAASWTEPAIARAVMDKKRIFPVLLDDAQPPEALQGIKAADFRLSFDDGYFSLREALRTPPSATAHHAGH